MKKSVSGIVCSLSVAGIFIVTHSANASELEGQQKAMLETTTNDTNQSNQNITDTQTAEKQLEADTYANKKANPERNNAIHNTDDTMTQYQTDHNANIKEAHATSDKNTNEKVTLDKEHTTEQADKNNETSASYQKQQAPAQYKLEKYTDSKAQPQLPSQSTTHQHNPGNNPQHAEGTDKEDEIASKAQPKEQQSPEMKSAENSNKNTNLIKSNEKQKLDTKHTKEPSKQPQQSNTESTTQELNNQNVSSDQAQNNEHRYAIMTIGKDNTEKNLTWYHESKEQGYVEIAEANDSGDFSNATRIEGETHKSSNTKRTINKGIPRMNYTQATIPNLEENKEYMYRFYNGDNGEKSAVRRFDTNNNGETNFIAAADPQLGASGDLEADNAGWQNTVNQMAQLNQDPDFLMSLGDQVNLPWDEQAYSGFIEAKGMENFTVVPTLGNHDRANKAYSEHFNLPNLQNGGKNLASSDFYFTYNDTLFVSLNSESLDFKGHEETLKRAIADTEDQNPKWIVGLTHRNPYSAGKHSDKLASKIRRDKFAPLMEKYNVDLVLGGHDHSYSRSHVM